jgi:hypothetical protein
VEKRSRPEKPTDRECLGGFRVQDELWEIISGCWTAEPHLRWTMKHVLACLRIDVSPIYQPAKPPFLTAIASRECECHFSAMNDIAHACIDLSDSDDSLSFSKGDVIEVMDCTRSRWHVRNTDGDLGCTRIFFSDIWT